jgi:hypothetical protein
MKVSELVILVKYAQGLIVIDSFLDFFTRKNNEEQRIFLQEMIQLIRELRGTDREIAIASPKTVPEIDTEYSEKLWSCLLDNNSSDIVTLLNNDSKMNCRLLLHFFSEVYKDAYKENSHEDLKKFWYWDFSLTSVSFKTFQLDLRQELDLKTITR